MLETQISQVARQQAAQATPGGSFPGQPQPNPKGHANDIALRNRTTYNEPVDPRLKKPKSPKKDVVITPEKQETEEHIEPEKKKKDEFKNKEEVTNNQVYIPSPSYKPFIPYP